MRLYYQPLTTPWWPSLPTPVPFLPLPVLMGHVPRVPAGLLAPPIIPTLHQFSEFQAEWSACIPCCSRSPVLVCDFWGIRPNSRLLYYHSVTWGSEVAHMSNAALLRFLSLPCLSSNQPIKLGHKYLVISHDYLPLILSMAHESPLAGHFSHMKTEMKVAEHDFWSRMVADIKTFCRSCHKCQKFFARDWSPPKPIPNTKPCSRVCKSLVGSLSHQTGDGHRYIMTMVFYATGSRETVSLKDIDSISVTDALLSIFTHVGIPQRVLPDLGIT